MFFVPFPIAIHGKSPLYISEPDNAIASPAAPDPVVHYLDSDMLLICYLCSGCLSCDPKRDIDDIRASQLPDLLLRLDLCNIW